MTAWFRQYSEVFRPARCATRLRTQSVQRGVAFRLARLIVCSRCEDVLNRALEDFREAEGERQRRVESASFDRDDCLPGDTEFVGEALL